MEDVFTFYGHLVYFTNIWYIFVVLVSCSSKNLATLVPRNSRREGLSER
jgi:hypothetical protein